MAGQKFQPSLAGLVLIRGGYPGLSSWATFSPSLRDSVQSSHADSKVTSQAGAVTAIGI